MRLPPHLAHFPDSPTLTPLSSRSQPHQNTYISARGRFELRCHQQAEFGATSAHDNGLEAWRAAGITNYDDVHIVDDASKCFTEHAPDIYYWWVPADDYLGLHDHSW